MTNDSNSAPDAAQERVDLWRVRDYPMWQHFEKTDDTTGILSLVADRRIEIGELFKLGFLHLKIERVIDKRPPRGDHKRPAVFYAFLVSYVDLSLPKL